MKLNPVRIILPVLTLVVVFTSSLASAQDLGVVVGYRSDSADSGSATTTLDTMGNVQVGAVGKFQLSEAFWLRSGMIYIQRSYGFTTTLVPATGTYKATYFEIPLGLLWKLSDAGGVFAGGAFNLGLSNKCDISAGATCSFTGHANSPFAAQLGASFKVAPQFGFEIYYEALTGNKKIAEGIDNARAIAANLMITFD